MVSSSSEKEMKKQITQTKKYKILIVKAWYDTGYSHLGLIKYIMALVGIDMILANSLMFAIGVFILYGLVCLVYGALFFKLGWKLTEMEVGNQYNDFVRNMRREYLKKSKLIKGKG